MVTAGGAAAASLWPTAPAQVHEQAGVHFHRDPGGWFRRYASRRDRVRGDARRPGGSTSSRRSGSRSVEDAHGRFERAYAPAFRDALRLFDDVADLLEAAARADLPVGLLTNSAAHATAEKLEVLRALRRLPGRGDHGHPRLRQAGPAGVPARLRADGLGAGPHGVRRGRPGRGRPGGPGGGPGRHLAGPARHLGRRRRGGAVIRSLGDLGQLLPDG